MGGKSSCSLFLIFIQYAKLLQSLPDNNNSPSLKFDVRIAIESSWNSYKLAGLKGASTTYIDRMSRIVTDGKNYDGYLKSPGTFTIPICNVDPEKRSFADFIKYLDDPGMNSYRAR